MDPQSSLDAHYQPPRPRTRLSRLSSIVAGMPSPFNIARGAIYGTVLLWTVICLAIAVHLHGLLASSDLTRFVPFAIFVCSASLAVMLALLGFTLMKEDSPVSTKIELACLGLIGTFWLSLGAYLATSDSDEAEVECYSTTDSITDVVEMPGFSTDTYHAQYRVLEAFSLFNTILVWGFLLLLLALALRQHTAGHRSQWECAVTSYPWFGKGKGKGSPGGGGKYTTRDKGKLPEPATSRSRSGTRSHNSRSQSRGRPAERTRRFSVWGSGSHQQEPARAHLAQDKYDKFKRGASPRR